MEKPTRDERLKILAAMRIYGGGFVGALAEAWLRADDDNEELLWGTFSHIMKRYAEYVDK